MRKARGVAATGHPETSRAAVEVLRAGGNAFDAILGGLAAACVTEPLLASLGGGGFLLARPADGPPRVYDFFVETPRGPATAEALDFYPIDADFGTTTQEFHIGRGSIGVPGVVAGLFAVHQDLGRVPLEVVLTPAIERARDGVVVNEFQHHVAEILAPILAADPAAMALMATERKPTRVARVGETVTAPDLANAFGMLLHEGAEWFYHGEPARQLLSDCADGGRLTAEDLAEYRVIRRVPVRLAARGASLAINAPPSPGGCLIAFALGLLEQSAFDAWGDPGHALALVEAMRLAQELRRDEPGVLGEQRARELLGAQTLAEWRQRMAGHDTVNRGTTHLSVADADGHLASLTISNGEGSAYVLPGTGIMLNNMLGEADLNPDGFHRAPAGRRLASMMAPAVLQLPDGSEVALGSGGSNRIRSAMLQVLVNLLHFGMGLEASVAAPRLHLEDQRLSVEHGFDDETRAALAARWPDLEAWSRRSLFFGGVHAVRRAPGGGFEGAGDPRRGGAVEWA